MDITVLELHLPQAEFSTPFSNRDRSDDEETDVRAGPPEESEGGGVSGVAAIAVLVGLAVLAWYLRSGRGDEDLESEGVMAEEPA